MYKIIALLSVVSACLNASFAEELAPPKLLTKDLPPPFEKLKSDIVKEEHTINIQGKTLAYESLAGTLDVKSDAGKNNAHIFFTAYFLKGAPSQNRPLTFCFNGGPGSSSIWLHMGVLGPKRVVIHDLGENVPPGRYENNPYTLLADSDLVFVDPVSTGFSRAADGVEAKQFYGVEEDIASVAEFVREFTTIYNRWGSPKFLLGESYGTLRVVGLADKLYESYYMNVNGLILISSCLDFQTSGIDSDNDLSYALILPSYAATAWYHKKLSPEFQKKTLQEILTEAEQFACNDYATALLLGDELDKKKKTQIAEKLAALTGLSVNYIERANLRIPNYRFYKKLLQDSQKVIGHFDSRYTGTDFDGLSEMNGYDPSFDAVTGSFTSAFQEYLQKDLKVERNSPYYIINRDVQPWNWGQKNRPAGFGYLSLSDQLRSAMIKNPSLQVFIASGYYDLVTPYFAANYTINHLHLQKQLRDNVIQAYYDAGHMMYLHEPSLVKFTQDLKQFLKTEKS